MLVEALREATQGLLALARAAAAVDGRTVTVRLVATADAAVAAREAADILSGRKDPVVEAYRRKLGLR